MMQIHKWVVEYRWVSSKKRTKIFSLVFALMIFLTGTYSFLSIRETIASDINEEKIIELTNQSRVAAGKGGLAANAKLSNAAKAKAEDMIAHNYFSHTSPEGATPWSWIQKEGYDYDYAGENLAMDFHSAEKMEDAWMASPTHRANVLNEKYSEVGTAVKEGNINGQETILVVVMFGSGDRNFSEVKKSEKEISQSQEKGSPENNFPALPLGAEKKNALVFGQPLITSPQFGETVSEGQVKIFGRARPGESVDVFDGEKFLGSAVADLNGWFSFSAENFSEGKHEIALKSKKEFSQTETEFFVDQKKPDASFHLFVSQEYSQKIFLEAVADKDNCIFQFNGETRRVARGEKVLFFVGSEKSSSILWISDQVGNKNFLQINTANYYLGSEESQVSEEVAGTMYPPENIFTADSGREAMRNNLGIAQHQFLTARFGDNN